MNHTDNYQELSLNQYSTKKHQYITITNGEQRLNLPIMVSYSNHYKNQFYPLSSIQWPISITKRAKHINTRGFTIPYPLRIMTITYMSMTWITIIHQSLFHSIMRWLTITPWISHLHTHPCSSVAVGLRLTVTSAFKADCRSLNANDWPRNQEAYGCKWMIIIDSWKVGDCWSINGTWMIADSWWWMMT